MKFRYKKLGAQILRPVIPIDILSGSEMVRYEVLVDSGADCTIVPAEIGDLLGLDVTGGRNSEVGGITGGGMPYFVHQGSIRVGGWASVVPVGSCGACRRSATGLWGSAGSSTCSR